MRKILPRRLGEKLILSILCLISFLFFSNDFSLVDIQKTAIVLATGIDRTEDGYEVTAVIAEQKSGDSGSGTPAEQTVSREGKTVAEAVRRINTMLGQICKFPFCDLVLLGERTTEENVLSVLGYFIRNEYASDNCLLAVCQGRASDTLSTKLPLEDMVTEGLKKILSSEAKRAGNVAAVNLKDFSADYFGEGRSGHMPYLRTIGDGAERMVDAARIALFLDGKKVALLDETESFAFRLLDGNLRTATLSVETDGERSALGLKSIDGGAQIEINDGVPTAKLFFHARAQLQDGTRPQDVRSLTNSLSVPEKTLKKAESDLSRQFHDLFTLSQKTNCDFFHLVDRLKKKSPRLYRAYRQNFLQRIEPTVVVRIEDRA